MVRAILEGRKTQTRRILNPQPVRSLPHTKEIAPGLDLVHGLGWRWKDDYVADGHVDALSCRCPYGAAGDRLWLRETWGMRDERGFWDQPVTRAHTVVHYRSDAEIDGARWRPSIYMPRWASRITLELTSVRVERLHQISEADARAEGVEPAYSHRVYPSNEAAAVLTYCSGFHKLWDSINGKRAPWASNPWLWVLEFKRIEARSV